MNERGNAAQNNLRIPDKARRCPYYHSNAMKDQQILQSLKLYLEFLHQDSSCNPAVMQHVKERIRQLEQN